MPPDKAQMVRCCPGPPLDRYVECLWWSRRDTPQDNSEHMLPSGSVQLVFALHESPIVCWPDSSNRPIRWSGSVVHGPQWAYYVAAPKPRGVVAGVSFRPGAAGAVLGVPVAELTGRHVPFDALWGQRAHELREQLMATAEPTMVFRILERSLSTRIHRPLLMHPAVAHLLAPGSEARVVARIADAQREAGYSPRHFIALFRAAVGLTPKHYYRIRRFGEAARGLADGSGAGLADLAASLGYSDQAHLTREFREFAGVTPSGYMPAGPASPLHHRVAGQSTSDKENSRRQRAQGRE